MEILAEGILLILGIVERRLGNQWGMLSIRQILQVLLVSLEMLENLMELSSFLVRYLPLEGRRGFFLSAGQRSRVLH